MGSLPKEDGTITEDAPWEQPGQSGSDPDQTHVSTAGVVGGAIGFAGKEYNKFHPRVKAVIRWGVLVVALTFGMNHGVDQFKRTLCHLKPSSGYFCGNPTPKSPPTEVDNPATEGHWFISAETWLFLIILLVLLAAVCIIMGLLLEKKGVKTISNNCMRLGKWIMYALLLSSLLALVDIFLK